MTSATLSTVLSFYPNNKNAGTFRDELNDLGVAKGLAVMKAEPRLHQVRTFFRTPSNWVYFSGHHISGHFFNRLVNRTAGFYFHSDRIEVYTPEGRKTLRKSHEFMLHMAKPQVLLWTGCNICSYNDVIQTIRTLFDSPLILGYSGQSVWRFTRKVFTGEHYGRGGVAIPKRNLDTDFFAELAKKPITDLEHVRDCWIGVARDSYPGGPNIRAKFTAIDPDGTIHSP